MTDFKRNNGIKTSLKIKRTLKMGFTLLLGLL